MFKKLITLIGVIATASCAFLFFHDSRTVKERSEYHEKELAKHVNVRKEIAFSVKPGEEDTESQELFSDYGRVLVKVIDVREWEDGYKIVFSVWNPNKLNIPNPKINLRWTYLLKEYESQYIKKWSNSFKEKEFSQQKDLKNNSWTDLEFFIAPCDRSHFEHVEFSIVG
jgi:hypothetical protein